MCVTAGGWPEQGRDVLLSRTQPTTLSQAATLPLSVAATLPLALPQATLRPLGAFGSLLPSCSDCLHHPTPNIPSSSPCRRSLVPKPGRWWLSSPWVIRERPKSAT